MIDETERRCHESFCTQIKIADLMGFGFMIQSCPGKSKAINKALFNWVIVSLVRVPRNFNRCERFVLYRSETEVGDESEPLT